MNVSSSVSAKPASRLSMTRSSVSGSNESNCAICSVTIRSAVSGDIAPSTRTTRPEPITEAYFAVERWRISELVMAAPKWSATSVSPSFHHLSPSSAPSVFLPSKVVHANITVSPRDLKKSRPSLLVCRQKAVIDTWLRMRRTSAAFSCGAWREMMSSIFASIPARSSSPKSVSTISRITSVSEPAMRFTSGNSRMIRGSMFLRIMSLTAAVSPRRAISPAQPVRLPISASDRALRIFEKRSTSCQRRNFAQSAWSFREMWLRSASTGS